MAELATLARPYAEAMFQVAQSGNLAQATSQIDALAKLAADPRVKDYVFVTKADALKRMKEKFPELTANLPSNPLPPSWEITPNRAEDVEGHRWMFIQPKAAT